MARMIARSSKFLKMSATKDIDAHIPYIGRNINKASPQTSGESQHTSELPHIAAPKENTKKLSTE
jgi:hypothetical protein